MIRQECKEGGFHVQKYSPNQKYLILSLASDSVQIAGKTALFEDKSVRGGDKLRQGILFFLDNLQKSIKTKPTASRQAVANDRVPEQGRSDRL